jgi:hypothetical protein
MAQVGEESLSRVSFDITPVIVFINLLIFTRLIFFSSEIVFWDLVRKVSAQIKNYQPAGRKAFNGTTYSPFRYQAYLSAPKTCFH